MSRDQKKLARIEEIRALLLELFEAEELVRLAEDAAMGALALRLPPRANDAADLLAREAVRNGTTPQLARAARELRPGRTEEIDAACGYAGWLGRVEEFCGPRVREIVAAAGIGSPAVLARWSSQDVLGLSGMTRGRCRRLSEAAASLGIVWGADLPSGPGQPSLSGEGESPRETVSLPPAVRAQVRARAKAEGISASAWIRRAVEAALGDT